MESAPVRTPIACQILGQPVEEMSRHDLFFARVLVVGRESQKVFDPFLPPFEGRAEGQEVLEALVNSHQRPPT